MNQHARHDPVVPEKSRRKFLKLAALGGGVSLLAGQLSAVVTDPMCSC